MPLPAEFLLPLFVLTLLANAILVAFAIRGMLRGQFDPDRHGGTGGRPNIDRAAPAVRPPDASKPADPAQPMAAGRATASAAPVTERVPVADAAPPEGTDPGLPADAAPRPKRRRTANGADQATAAIKAPAIKAPAIKAPAIKAPAIKPPRAEPRRGRRRFSLPPLDDDHERVSRSIESFLSGVDPTAESAEEVPAPGATDGATTVAIVLVDGLPDEPSIDAPSRARRSPRGAPHSGPVAAALAMVERTLRGAARGTDVVKVGDRGRFQIVLASTGELAARAYLRRIRSAIEPRLEASDGGLRLVVATATALDEPTEVAVQRAEHRLAIALEASRWARLGRADPSRESDDDADDEGTAPRAAAD